MEAVVSLLDEEHTRAVEEIWVELQRELGIHVARERVPFPHVTYQGADRYEAARLDAAFARIARATSPFAIETAGLGIFIGPLPVLYVSIARSPALAMLHQRIWHELGDAGTNISPLYDIERWMPHITLAQWDVTPENLPRIAQLLAGRPFAWRITLTNLAHVESESGAPDTHYRVRTRYEFAAS